MMKQPRYEDASLSKIVGGGQTLGTLQDGRKVFVWGALPGETATIRLTKSKAHYAEGVAETVDKPSPERTEPRDAESYLSTSPWQILSFDAEQHYKAALIEEAFELHNIVLPNPIKVVSDGVEYGYRNKVEFSWYGQEVNGQEQLDLAFFRRGSKGKIAVEGTSLARPEINHLARAIRDVLSAKSISARTLKTLLVRCDQDGNCVWQLYIKDKLADIISEKEAAALPAIGGEVIYSDPKSPASRITKRLTSFGTTHLTDTISGVPYRYAVESFFQVNIPVYQQALTEISTWTKDELNASSPLIDLYSGVGSIGLSIADDRPLTLVEVNEDAVREMRENIKKLGKQNATPVLAASEKAVDYITSETTVIVDPPRAGLHANVIDKLIESAPKRIIYLSCNPVTQARDVAMLSEVYGVRHHIGFNFFPRTPHIEHLVILDKKQ